MIDFHSHILYGIDDGAKDLDMSKNMLYNSKYEGTQCICASTHYKLGLYEPSKKLYFSRFMEVMNTSNIKIIPALEVYMDIKLPELYKQEKIWCINLKKYMLIEFPMRDVPKYSFEVLHELRVLGVTPIIAHPERNLKLIQNIDIVEELIKEGSLIQLNSGSLFGQFGQSSKEFSERLVKRNMVHVLGSDGHDNFNRKTNMKKGFLKIKELNERLYFWMEDNELSILKGEEINILEIDSENSKSYFSLKSKHSSKKRVVNY